MVRRSSGTLSSNPHDTLNEDATSQLRDNPAGVIKAYEKMGMPWDRIFDQIRDWAEAVSIKI